MREEQAGEGEQRPNRLILLLMLVVVVGEERAQFGSSVLCPHTEPEQPFVVVVVVVHHTHGS